MTVFDNDDVENDNVENDDATTFTETTTVERVGRLLNEAITPCKKPRLLTNGSYLERLHSFSPSTYFAKPIPLSPIVCAARGWSNIGTDMLECSHCNAKLAIVFDSALNPDQIKKVSQKYQDALVTTGHANELCLFYNKERQTHPQEDENDYLPLFLSSVLDPDFVHLMEHPSPQAFIVQRIQDQLGTMTTILPQINVEHDDLLQQSVRIIMKHVDNKDAILFALTGWSVCATNGESNPSTPLITCQLCLATHRETTTPTTNDAGLFSSHKYYCPYLCGISIISGACNNNNNINDKKSEPCWKTICRKIVEAPTTTADVDLDDTPDDALARIQKLLQQ